MPRSPSSWPARWSTKACKTRALYMSPNEIPPMAQTSFWSAVFQQAAKDLRTSFRDRSTLIQTILVPLALYLSLIHI